MPHQRWLRIIPVAFVMYTIAFIDRTNISLAIPSIRRDLGMDSAQAGAAAGIFFWGYLLLQVPGGYLASRWSAKRFVSLLLVGWGLCAVGCGLVHTWRELWLMRFLLGVAEGGVWPATLVLLSRWFPRAERARANAFWMLCLPAAVVVSSPVSGWILERWNWRTLLVAEGAVPFLWLLVWATQIDDYPRQARWISAAERDFLEATLQQESFELEHNSSLNLAAYWRALLAPQVWILTAVYFLLTGGNYGYLFWLPSAVAKAQSLSSGTLGWLFALPYVMTGIGMVLVSRHSDRVRERRGHVAASLALAGVALLAGVVLSARSPLLAFLILCLAGAGSYGALGPFWSIPTETLPSRVAGPAMGLVNALGNLGGYFGPLVVGYLNQRTGTFASAFSLLAAGWLAGGVLALALKRSTALAARGAGVGSAAT